MISDLYFPKSEDIEKSKKKLFNRNPPWDPIGEIDLDNIRELTAKTEARFDKLKNNPNIKWIHFIYAWSIFIVCAIIFVIFYNVFGFHRNQILIIIIGISTIVTLLIFYEKLGRNLVKLQIAKQKNWVYNPEEEGEKTLKILSEKYPEIFKKKNLRISEQYWGEFNYKNEQISFYSGIVSYTKLVVKYQINFEDNFFFIKLKNPLNCRFHLYPIKFAPDNSKKINTESIKFNEKFAFEYSGSKGKNSQEIVKTLSPVIISKLLDLNYDLGDFSVLFVEDTIIFLFRGRMLKNPKTNILEELEISKEDMELIENRFERLIDLGQDMYRYLD